MTTVTFKLNDFGIASMEPYAPRVYFVPSGPAVIATEPDDYLVSSRIITATLGPDGETYSATFFPSSWALPVPTFRLVIEWLDAASNFISRDAPGWELFISDSDGHLVDMIRVDRGAFWVWVGSTPPPSGAGPGSWWMDETTGDLYEWEN